MGIMVYSFVMGNARFISSTVSFSGLQRPLPKRASLKYNRRLDRLSRALGAYYMRNSTEEPVAIT